MFYEGNVFRPPSEANSLILQVTLGCSNFGCTFCGMYPDKTFRIKPFEQLAAEIDLIQGQVRGVRRIFLADGDAMVLSTNKLISILDLLNDTFPELGRVGIYANARDLRKKSPEDLAELKRRKLGIVYIGLESGDPVTLKAVNKRMTVEDNIEGCQKANAAGMKTSVMVLLGLGGKERSLIHAAESGKVLTKMNPRFASLLTLTLVPGTPIHEDYLQGKFHPIDPRESLLEAKTVLENLDLKDTFFACNHASNYLPLKGRLPQDKPRFLQAIDKALKGDIPLRPEFLRGL